MRKDDTNQTMLQAFQYGSTNARLMDYDALAGLNKLFASVGGTALAEYTEFTSTVMTWTKSYTYFGDSQLSTITPNGSGGENVEFNHPDRLGTKLITNQQTGGNSEQAHLPFGKALDAESSVTNNNKRFTSYDRSTRTGLDYAVNRFYDSAQGRFTTVDPIKMAATSTLSPQSLNLYSYTENDPVNRSDPSGLDWPTLGGGGNPTINSGGIYGGGFPGRTGFSIPSWLSSFLNGILGNIFGGGNQWYPGMQVGPTVYFWQFNTASITPSAPPPLPGAGTTNEVVSPGGVGDPGSPIEKCGFNPVSRQPGIRDDKPNSQGLRQ